MTRRGRGGRDGPGGRGAASRLLALALGSCAALLAGEALVRVGRPGGEAGVRGGYDAPISRHDPRLGWRLLPGAVARHRGDGFDVPVAINAEGMRQTPPVPLARTPGVPRVLGLGDSFTFGHGVREEQRWTERLAAALGAEVVNAGVPATGTDQQVLLYEALPDARAAADLVLLLCFLDDVARNGVRVREGRPKPAFVLGADGLELVGVPVPERPTPDAPAADDAPRAASGKALAGLRAWLWEHSELYVLLRRGAIARRPGPPAAEAASDAAWEVTRALIDRLADDAAARGARLAVAIVPDARDVRDGSSGAARARLARACAMRDVPCLDLQPALAAAPAPPATYFPRDGHWTPAGHEVAARALAPFVRGLLPGER